MKENININSSLYLDSLYEHFFHTINLTNKRIINNSALLTLIRMNSNDSFKVISNASLSFPSSSFSDLEPLITYDLITKLDVPEKRGEYVITITGLWYIESRRNGLSINSILHTLQQDRFSFQVSNRPLSDLEKVIVFSLLSIRSFSENVSMNLNTDELCNKWSTVISEVISPYLLRNKVIKNKPILSQKSGNQHPVAYAMRHANNLPKKTNSIFCPSKKNQYYLALEIDDHNKSKEQIAFLIKSVFGNINSIDKNEEIKEFLCNSAYNLSSPIVPTFQYISFEWDKVIQEALDQGFLDYK